MLGKAYDFGGVNRGNGLTLWAWRGVIYLIFESRSFFTVIEYCAYITM